MISEGALEAGAGSPTAFALALECGCGIGLDVAEGTTRGEIK